MNIYSELNKIIEYVEEHLEENIESKTISRMIGMNEYTFQKIFVVIANVTFTEYIRNRRLSNAGQEIYLEKDKVIDIAIKYQYNSPTAFSRAFEKFHGIKPSEVKKKPERLKMYTKLHFNENYECNKNIDYKIIEKEELHLYGTYILTNDEKIKEDAPKFYCENMEKHGEAPYALVEYHDKERTKVKAYWVLYYEPILGMIEKTIPKSKWIVIRINSQDAKEIQEISETFYADFLPIAKYNYRDLPEIEYYHDNITDFLVPIEN